MNRSSDSSGASPSLREALRQSFVARRGGRNLALEIASLLAALGLALGLRFFVPTSQRFFDGMELKLLDARFLAREGRGAKEANERTRVFEPVYDGKKLMTPGVSIIAMDDAVLRRYQSVRGALPRQVHARLINRLKADGATAIIFDVLFIDPATPVSDDVLLARACRDAGNVFLPFDHNSTLQTPPALLRKIESKLSYPLPPEAGAASHTVRLQTPLPIFWDQSAGSGHVVTQADSDKTYRRSVLLMEAGRVYPHVALEAIRRTVWGGAPKPKVEMIGDSLLIDGHEIAPLDRRPLLRTQAGSRQGRAQVVGTGWAVPLDFVGSHAVMQGITVPYLDALVGRNKSRIKDHIVIIGATASGTPDLRPGPLDTDETFLGVETNATLLANLLHGDFLQQTSRDRTIGAMLVAGLLSGLMVMLLRPWGALAFATLGAFIYTYAAMSTFIHNRLVIEMAGPLFAILCCYGLPTSYRLIAEERAGRDLAAREQKMNQLMGQYVDPRLSNQLRDDPEAQSALEIGTRREVTVLFTDIRGFTAWSEQQLPEEVKARLDEYFPTMCEIVADDHAGYIDKYIGDALMVVWNSGIDGLDQPDHAARAVRAAVAMQRALEVLNEGWRRQGQQEFRIGIGIATGRVVFGSFGSKRHKLQPTALGDTVNLAARLEGATKETGATIIISQATQEGVERIAATRMIDAVAIRGKVEAVCIYEVLGLRSTTEMDAETNADDAQRTMPQATGAIAAGLPGSSSAANHLAGG